MTDRNTATDDGCPKGDPDCLADNGDNHDACLTFTDRERANHHAVMCAVHDGGKCTCDGDLDWEPEEEDEETTAPAPIARTGDRSTWPLWLVCFYIDGDYGVDTFSERVRAPDSRRAWSRAKAAAKLSGHSSSGRRVRDWSTATEIETVQIDGAAAPGADSYALRFPTHHRETAERAYSDGFSDGGGDTTLADMLAPDELATILAALRYYQENGQGDPANRSDAIHNIATDGDAVISLDDDGIEELCQRINLDKPRAPGAQGGEA